MINTYYELVSYLDSIITSAMSDDVINKLNNLNMNLSSDRYVRFTVQISYVCNERLKHAFDNLIDKIAVLKDNNSIILELDSFKEEKNFLLKLVNIQYIKKDDKSWLEKEIVENFIKALNELKNFINDEELTLTIDSLINGGNNEL